MLFMWTNTNDHEREEIKSWCNLSKSQGYSKLIYKRYFLKLICISIELNRKFQRYISFNWKTIISRIHQTKKKKKEEFSYSPWIGNIQSLINYIKKGNGMYVPLEK